MKTYTTASLLLCLLGSAIAQKTQEVPPPQEPFVEAVPQNCAWIITAEPPAKPPEGEANNTVPTEARIKYTKVGETQRIETTLSNGETSERWQIGTISLWQPKGQEPIVTENSGADDYDAKAQRQFPGVSWISLVSYDQPVTFETKLCYRFATEGQEAWIACDSKLPVAYKISGVLHRYTFLPTPAGPLHLPAEFQASWDAAMRIINRRNQLQKDLGSR